MLICFERTHESDPAKDSEIKYPNNLLFLGRGPGQVVHIERVLLALGPKPFVTIEVAVIEGRVIKAGGAMVVLEIDLVVCF